MILLVTGASHTGKTIPAKRHNVNNVLLDDKYEVDIDLTKNPSLALQLQEHFWG